MLWAQSKYWSCLRGLLPHEPPQPLHTPFRNVFSAPASTAGKVTEDNDATLQPTSPVGGTDPFRSASMMSEEVSTVVQRALCGSVIVVHHLPRIPLCLAFCELRSHLSMLAHNLFHVSWDWLTTGLMIS